MDRMKILVLFFVLTFIIINLTSLKKEYPIIPQGGTMVCFGDSLTAGYGAREGNSYPDFLQKRVNLKIINSGVSGDTTVDARKRFEEDVLEHNPDIVVIELGANDLFQSIDPKITAINLNYFVDQLTSRGITTYVVRFHSKQFLLTLLKRKRMEEFDILFKSFEKRENLYIIYDIWKGIWGKDSMMSDKIHPNDRGYEKMANIYFKELKPLLKANDLIIE